MIATIDKHFLIYILIYSYFSAHKIYNTVLVGFDIIVVAISSNFKIYI